MAKKRIVMLMNQALLVLLLTYPIINLKYWTWFTSTLTVCWIINYTLKVEESIMKGNFKYNENFYKCPLNI